MTEGAKLCKNLRLDLGKYYSFFQPRLHRPVVIFQSDDWGFNRLGDRESHKSWMKSNNHEISKIQQVDFLENSDDLICLSDVLCKHKDVLGNNPCMTMNFIISNPDFIKIEASNFSKYYRTTLAESYRKIWSETDIITQLLKFKNKGIFDFQYHGIDHLRWKLWMQALKEKDANTVSAFYHGICGMNSTRLYSNRVNFMAPFDSFGTEEAEYLKDAVLGIQEFEQLFGHTPTSFIAPGYIWSKWVEKQLSLNGIQNFQGLPKQILPTPLGMKYKAKRRIINCGNEYSYTLRNCYFEPVENRKRDFVSDCLKRMQFFIGWGLPVVINTHRFNYVSGYSKDNRDYGLKELDRLLTAMIKRWPTLLFSSTQDYIIKIQQ